MKFRLIAVGDRPPPWIAQGFADYQQRLSRWWRLDLIEITPSRRPKGATQRAIDEEGDRVLAAIRPQHQVIALDGVGQPWTSVGVAEQMEHWKMTGVDISFLIGGPDGHAPQVLARATERWSLGPLTLPHMLVRLIVIEQLYRAASLSVNHPYHRA